MIVTNKSEQLSSGPKHYGSKPKKIAFGIAPLGYISIGTVPIGVVSLGVVAMGIVNASIVGMGIFSAGITTMGIKVWNPMGPAIANKSIEITYFLLKTFLLILRNPRQKKTLNLGCIGVHKMGDLWMPCATHGITQ
tara:strand:- start:1002 stop:1409 length:408 start_codon:yes stop_codon:yes gene_type:complete